MSDTSTQNYNLVLHFVLAMCFSFQISDYVPQQHIVVIMPNKGFTSKESNNRFYSRIKMVHCITKTFCGKKSWAKQFYAQFSFVFRQSARNVHLSVYYFNTIPENCHDTWGFAFYLSSSALDFWEKNLIEILFKLTFILAAPINTGCNFITRQLPFLMVT